MAVVQDYDTHYHVKEGDTLVQGWVVTKILSDRITIRHPASGATATIGME